MKRMNLAIGKDYKIQNILSNKLNEPRLRLFVFRGQLGMKRYNVSLSDVFLYSMPFDQGLMRSERKKSTVFSS